MFIWVELERVRALPHRIEAAPLERTRDLGRTPAAREWGLPAPQHGAVSEAS
jgi:hypothetical protein